MAEQQRQSPAAGETHRLVLEQRRRLTVTEVTEVLHVEADSVVLRLGQSLLVVRGEGLSLKQLTPSDGVVEIRGQTTALSYEQPRQGGLLRRVFDSLKQGKA